MNHSALGHSPALKYSSPFLSRPRQAGLRPGLDRVNHPFSGVNSDVITYLNSQVTLYLKICSVMNKRGE